MAHGSEPGLVTRLLAAERVEADMSGVDQDLRSDQASCPAPGDWKLLPEEVGKAILIEAAEEDHSPAQRRGQIK